MMKFSLSKLRSTFLQATHHKPLNNFFTSSPRLLTSLSTQKQDNGVSVPQRQASHLQSGDSLYKRISPVGEADNSIVPVLNQWIAEGRKVYKEELQNIIKSLKVFRRFKHALEISQWMTDRRYMPPSPGDMGMRLYLIYKVHGLEKAEEYFNNIARVLKRFEVLLGLLNCYVEEKSVEKAEAIMQKIRDIGHATTALPYNVLMRLYCNVGSWEKIDVLMNEMKDKGIYGDRYTFTIQLSAYAAASDIDGLDMIMKKMESDPRVVMNSSTYILAAKAHFKLGLVDKGSEILKKLEGVMATSKNKHSTFNYVLKLYAEIGNKDELYRFWNMYKEENVYNKGYMSMISSILKFDDIEGAEKIFEEWESRGLSYDFRVPDYLIDAYVKKGHLRKAEDLLKRGIEKGGNPSMNTWYYLGIIKS